MANDPEDIALALIGAPSRFSKAVRSDETLATADCGDEEFANEHTIIDVSFTNLPADIDQRFERLIKIFDLEVVKSAINKLSPRNGKSRSPRKNGVVHGVKDKTTKKIKPGWKMYLLCRTNW